jgi:VWFA-related protein
MVDRIRPAAAALTAALVAVCAGAVFSAQQATFRAEAAGVNLDVSVTRGGRPVRGLTAADFVLTDGGLAQRVDSAALETLPLSVFLVIDTSGSVAGEKMQHLTAACRALIDALKGGDRIALMTFAGLVQVKVPLTEDLTVARAALDRLSTGGPTALRDAVFSALQLVPADRTRPVVLVFSDGRDTASWLSAPDVLGAVRRSGVVVHAVELVDTDVSSPFLGELVTAAGGRRWSANTPVRLTTLFTDALNEMRSRYLLTYYPTNAEQPGWHPVTVKLARTRADVTSRPGYQVPPRN